jgi:SdrD B-like domain
MTVNGRSSRGFVRSRLIFGAALLATVASGLAVSQEPAEAKGITGLVTGYVFRDYNSDGIQNLGNYTFTEPFQDWRTREEPGVGPGIHVIAHDARDRFVGEDWTDGNGYYELPIDNSKSKEVRVELQIYDDWKYLKYGRRSWDPSNRTNADSAFTTVGATHVDFNLLNPTDYCQENPRLATPCWRYGDQHAANPRGTLKSWWLNDTTPSRTPTQDPIKDLALETQIGTTFGLAYNRATDTLFAAAYLRRFAGFGPGGTGAIYAIKRPYGDPSGPADQQPSVSIYVDLNAVLGAATAGADPHPSLGSGVTGRMSNPPTETEAAWFHDSVSFSKVNKVSLGDIAISEDMRTLFVVNQNTEEIYKFSAVLPPASASDITPQKLPVAGCANSVPPPPPPPSGGGTPAGYDDDKDHKERTNSDPRVAVGSIPRGGRGRMVGQLVAKPDPLCGGLMGGPAPAAAGGDAEAGTQTCAQEDSHPMAIALHDGYGYLGITCSAESTQNPDQLRAYVYLFDPKTLYIIPEPIVDVGFADWRYCDRSNIATARPGRHDSGYCADAQWQPWTDVTPTIPPTGTFPPFGYPSAADENIWWGKYPLPADNSQYYLATPILSTIAFDGHNMILGVRNRAADQLGPSLGTADPLVLDPLYPSAGHPFKYVTSQTRNGVTTDTTTTEIGQGDSTRGEIIYACKTNTGIYEVEHAERQPLWSGGPTDVASWCGSDHSNRHHTWGRSDATQTHFMEYFAGSERTMGSVFHLTGSRDVLSTGVDPAGAAEANGIIRFYAKYGSQMDAPGKATNFQVYQDKEHTAGGSATNEGLFAKSNGLGDLEVLCDQAPTEIGDRVWLDTNGDGVQSANTVDEPGLPGVRVNLLNNGGAIVASVQTSPTGHFAFSSGPNPSPAFGAAAEWNTPASLDGSVNRVYMIDVLRGFQPNMRLEIDPSTLPAVGSPPTPLRPTTSTEDPSSTSGSAHVRHTSKMYSNFISFPFNVSSGASRHDLDLGLSTMGAPLDQPVFAAVGDQVFADVNNDGAHDTTEPGVAGVQVTLVNEDFSPAVDGYGRVIATQTTNARGQYLFADVKAGSYRIRFTLPNATDQFVSLHSATPAANDDDSDAKSDGVTEPFAIDDINTLPLTEADRAEFGASRVGFSQRINRNVDAGMQVPAGFKPPT